MTTSKRRRSITSAALVLLLLPWQAMGVDKIGGVRDRVPFGGFLVRLDYRGAPPPGRTCSDDIVEAVQSSVEECFFQSDVATDCYFDPIYVALDGAQCRRGFVSILGGIMGFTASTYTGTQSDIDACVPEILSSSACAQAIQSRIPTAEALAFVADTPFPTTQPTSATPTVAPSASPTSGPTAAPRTPAPSPMPIASPTQGPTVGSTQRPTTMPTASPVSDPTPTPSPEPTASPTAMPSDTTTDGGVAVRETGSPTSAPTALGTTSNQVGDANRDSVTGTGGQPRGPTATTEAPPDNTGMIVGAVVGGTLLLLLLVGLEYKRRQKRGSAMPVWKSASNQTAAGESFDDDQDFDASDLHQPPRGGLSAADSLSLSHIAAQSLPPPSSIQTGAGRMPLQSAGVIGAQSLGHGGYGCETEHSESTATTSKQLSAMDDAILFSAAAIIPTTSDNKSERKTDSSSSDGSVEKAVRISPLVAESENRSLLSSEGVRSRVSTAISSLYGCAYVSEPSEDGDDEVNDIDAELANMEKDMKLRDPEDEADFALDPSWNPDDTSVGSRDSPDVDPFANSSPIPPDDAALLDSTSSRRSYSMEPLEIPPELKDRPRTPRSSTPRQFLT